MGKLKEPISPKELPSTSLIICSRNRPEFLNELVYSILRGDELPTELIIVDDSDECNETLATLVPCRPCEFRYLWNRSVGLSRANNTGVTAAKYDLLVFTQDDVLVEPTWFGTLIRAQLAAGPGCVVTGKVLPGEAEEGGGFAPSTKSDDSPVLYKGRIERDVLFAQNMVMYRSIFNTVGWFDSRIGPGTPYPAAEDNDFGYRLLEQGYQILYEPRAVTAHRAWRSKEEYQKLHWNYGRGQGAYYSKYIRRGDLHMLKRMMRDIFQHAVRFPIRLWRQREQARVDAFYIGGLVFGACHWLLTQRLGKT